MGKTGLIRHIFEKEILKDTTTKNLRDLTIKQGKAVLGSLDTLPVRVLTKH